MRHLIKIIKYKSRLPRDTDLLDIKYGYCSANVYSEIS